MISLFSPAKLNLTFRVLKKRPDGFHEIDSLFQAIDLGDHIHLSLSDKDSLTCKGISVPLDRTNLIFQAIDLFRKKTGLSECIRVDLEKNIPIQSGLGGGSSNAASTLWGINRLLKTEIADEQLADWGKEIGSDVPFFFSTGRARCQGRGEILTSLSPVPAESIWLAKPAEGLVTAKVYGAISSFSSEMRDGFFNDLEEAAFSVMPKLVAVKEGLLECGFKEVHMTGSGSAFFCLGSPLKAPEGVELIPAKFLYRDRQHWYKYTS